MSLPTVADLKVHLDIPSANTTNDAELGLMLDAALDVVRGIIGPVTSGSVSETHRRVSSEALILRRLPVSDLVDVSSRVGVSLTSLSLSDFELNAEAGLVYRADGGPFVGDFTVTYYSGRSAVPPAVHLAALIIAGHLWETQRGNTGGGPLAADTDTGYGVTSSAGFAIPNRAKELLEPFVQTSLLA